MTTIENTLRQAGGETAGTQPNADPASASTSARTRQGAESRPVLGLIFTLVTFGIGVGASNLAAQPCAPRDTLCRLGVFLDQQYVHTFTLNSQLKRVTVRFTTTPTTPTSEIPAVDLLPPFGVNDWAYKTALWMEQSWRFYVNAGFRSPARDRGADGVEQLEAWISGRGGRLGVCCGAVHFALDGGMFAPGNDLLIQSVVFHEEWHSSTYIDASQCWVNEGTAAFMQDKVDGPLDLWPGNGYKAEADGFLGLSGKNLLTHCYTAALWWNYFTEQFGVTRVEPQLGIDALRDFYGVLGSGGPLAALDSVIRSRPGGRTMKTAWCDFAVANYVKNLAGVAGRTAYRYVDETQPPGMPMIYDYDGNPSTPTVPLELDLALAPGDAGAARTGTFEPWSVKYFRIRPDPSLPLVRIEFRPDTRYELCWTLLGLQAGNIALEERVTGPDLVRVVSNPGFDEIVVIAATFQDAVNCRFSVAGPIPLTTLRIIEPLTARPQTVGGIADRNKFLIKVDVLDPSGGGTPVVGLNPDLFRVRVGGITARLVGPGAYVLGQYWLLVEAPVVASEGLYDLAVAFGSWSDEQLGAVQYAALQASDNMVVIDRSGSMMDSGKMAAAQNAARLYIDGWQTGDKFGVASFSDEASADFPLADWDETARGTAADIIDDLMPDGATSIGDGAIQGLAELVARGDPAHTWSIVVLSDGMENRPASIQDFLDQYTTRRDAGRKVPVVHCLGLGPDANSEKLQRLADQTGGLYLWTGEPPPAPSGAFSAASTPSDHLPSLLADFYRLAAEAAERQQQIYSLQGEWHDGEVDQLLVTVEGGVEEAVFAVNWTTFPGQTGPSVVTLRRPDGVLVAPTLVDATHRLFRIALPMAGQWEVRVGCPGGEFCGGQYLVEAAVKSRLTLHLYLPRPLSERVTGAEMPVLAHLTDTDVLLGATVRASITIPEERGALVILPAETYQLTLFDDGLHGDGGRNDGLYGNVFHATQRVGSYDVIATATGTAPAHGAFARRARAAFYLAPDADTDRDEMPDRWEQRHGLNPLVADGIQDPDMDGLTNLEEFRQGTDPQNSDSDGGGENDGSERSRGRDPTERVDDHVAPIWGVNIGQAPHVSYDPQTTPFLNTVPLEFNLSPDHAHLTILRSQNPQLGYQLLTDNVTATNRFFDYQVTVGERYFYKILARNAAGDQSAVIGPVEAVARAEWAAPDGVMLINNGSDTATDHEVIVSIIADEDVVAMRLANNTAFEGAEWQSFASPMSWRLPDATQPGSTATIYGQLRDASGNEGILLHAAIRLSDSGCSPGLRIRPTVTHEWSCGVLQAADSFEGPYADIPGATSPFTTEIGPGRRYFRVRLP